MATADERKPLIVGHSKRYSEKDDRSHKGHTGHAKVIMDEVVTEDCGKILHDFASGQEVVGNDESGEHIVHCPADPTDCAVSPTVPPAPNMVKRAFCSGMPLKIFASIFGLWPIKMKWQLSIFAVVMIISSFIFAWSLYICVSCYISIGTAYATCEIISGGSVKISHGILVAVLSSSFYLLAPFSVLLSNLLPFYYVVKSSRKRSVLSLSAACCKISEVEWQMLNVQILIISLTHIAMFALYLVQLPNYSVTEQIVPLLFKISGFNMSLACWVFAILTCALRNKASECYDAIYRLNEGSLDDVIDMYENMCDDVFSTCRALQPWFVTHWINVGMTIVAIIFLGTFELRNDSRLYFSLLMVIYIFLLPCFYAARFTTKCQDALRDLNYTQARDWSRTHPFRCRVTLNHFIFYAERVRCGFRIFSFTFGDSFAWLSLLFSILTIIAKLIYHI